MIMILACCDFLVVLTYLPFTGVIAMLRLTENVNAAYTRWAFHCLRVSNIFVGFSLTALLMMNFDRYLATHYIHSIIELR